MHVKRSFGVFVFVFVNAKRGIKGNKGTKVFLLMFSKFEKFK
jgi:hypothetical protein